MSAVPHGTHVLNASAGTGKTTAIVRRVVALVLEDGLAIDRIAVLTFTVAATAELRARVRRALSEAAETAGTAQLRDRASRALANFDQAAISTMHGFCQQLRHALPLALGQPPAVALAPDPSDTRRRVALDHYLRLIAALPACAQAGALSLLGVLEDVAREGQDPDVAVVPAHPGPAPLPDLTAWTGAVEALAQAWAPEAFMAALMAAGTSKSDRKKDPPTYAYTTKKAQGDADALTAWLASPDALSAALPTKPKSSVDRFTTAAVQRSAPGAAATVAPVCAALDNLLNAHAAIALPMRRWQLAALHALIADVRTRLPTARRQQGERTYHELLTDVRDALRAPAGRDALVAAANHRFDVALVDEFQDTDPVQWDIFETLFADRLLLVGDPKQAIYRFRGADLPTWDRAVAGCPTTRLDTNYRSDAHLIAALNHLYTRPDVAEPLGGPSPVVTAVMPHHADRRLLGDQRAPLRLAFFPKATAPRSNRGPVPRTLAGPAVARWVAQDVRTHLDARLTVDHVPVTAGDCAVLVRSNNEARLQQAALRACGVPAHVRSEGSVLDAPVSRPLAAVLDALATPTDVAVRRAFTAPLVGQTADALVGALAGDGAAWADVVTTFRVWHRQWHPARTSALLTAWMDHQRVAARLLSRPDGERHLTDLRHLISLLHTRAYTHRDSLAHLVDWLAAGAPGAGEDATARRVASSADAVQVLTVHAAKGLEFPLVWCATLWRDAFVSQKHPLVFSDRDNGHRRTVDLGLHHPDDEAPARHLAWATEDALREEHRLAYVALTRARHRCTVPWLHGGRHIPLAALLHLPDDPTLLGEARAAAAQARLASDALAQEDLERLATHHAIDVEQASLGGGAPAPSTPPTSARATPLGVAPLRRSPGPDLTWRRTSYSGLTRDATTPWLSRAEPPTQSEVPSLPLAALRGGARLGVALHAVLEHADFQAPDTLPPLVHDALSHAGVDAETWTATVVAHLLDVLAAPLGDGLSLADLSPQDRCDELDFALPLRDGAGDPLSATTLAAAFNHPGAPPGTHASLAHLGHTPVRGLLVGSIDLVARHNGRYFLADYKSNHLGPAASDYGAERLQAAMDHAQYGLQAALYAVALHRWLALRLPGYTPDRDLGPVRYLFLRGMTPSAPGQGVWSWQPTGAFLDHLGAALNAAEER